MKWPKRWTPETLELFWRNGDPDFVGPVGPPMTLYLMAGCPPDPWMGKNYRDLLAGKYDDDDDPPAVGERFSLAF